MNKIKNYFMKNKVTIMVIPSAEKSIKQWKLNMAGAFLVLIALIIINLTLLINTITSKVVSDSLTSENSELSESLLMTQDKIDMLQNINANKTEEIKTLKLSLQNSNDFLMARLLEMEQTQAYVSQLVVLFNDETKSNVEVPISRSFSRLTEVSSTASNETLSPDELLLSEIESLISNDEISQIITDQTNAYTELVTKMASQISYLESRPDFYPTSGTYSSPFGYRRDPITGRSKLHNGIDISNKVGTAIFAAGTGIVTYSGYDGNFGNVMIVDHGYGYESVYAHCKTLLYSPGDKVTKGEQIATMGTSGRTTGPHLHFEIRYNETPINPLKFIQ
jgi:murein DD-endopeptidase MepM/ murein hydrolase activator NlpD